jgi:hypothetical protein
MILLLIFFSEQGRRNDLSTRHDGPVPQDTDNSIIINSTRTRSLISTPGSPTNIISDRVHCDSLSLVVSGSRCHTADYLKETKDAEDSLPCPMYCLSKPPPPWAHVFSKSSTNSSLRTQCATVASVDAFCPSVFHRCLCRARHKRRKQDCLLREIVIPSNQVKMFTTEIDSEIIVFDEGGICHLQYNHQMEFGGAPSLFKTFTLKTRLGVTSVFLSPELMGLPHTFVCLVVFHLKSSLMLDYQQYMILYAIVNN